MITQPNPLLIRPYLNTAKFFAKTLRCKAIVNMIGVLLLSLEIKGHNVFEIWVVSLIAEAMHC